MGVLYFIIGTVTLIGIYAALAMILNLVGGWGGLWDLGPAGILAVGAYAYVILTIDPSSYDDMAIAPGWPIWAGVIAAGVCGGLVSLLIGIPALRLRGEYFLITTFAFAEVIRQVLMVESSVTRGVGGISGVERPFNDVVTGADYRYVLLAIVVVVVLVLYLFVRRMSNAPFVRTLRASRDNEAVALSVGKDVTRYRLLVFVLAGVLFGLVAPVYVWYIRAVVPGLFVSDLTFVIWVALIVGGIGSVRGAVIGAVLIVGMTELVQLAQGSAEQANLVAASRPLLLGVVLIVVMRFRPEGLVPERWSFRKASAIMEKLR